MTNSTGVDQCVGGVAAAEPRSVRMHGPLTCRRALRTLIKDGVLVPGTSPNARPRVADPAIRREQTLADAARMLSVSLAQHRRSIGLTQPQLAVLADVSVTMIGHAETGRLWQSRDFWNVRTRNSTPAGNCLPGTTPIAPPLTTEAPAFPDCTENAVEKGRDGLHPTGDRVSSSSLRYRCHGSGRRRDLPVTWCSTDNDQAEENALEVIAQHARANLGILAAQGFDLGGAVTYGESAFKFDLISVTDQLGPTGELDRAVQQRSKPHRGLAASIH